MQVQPEPDFFLSFQPIAIPPRDEIVISWCDTYLTSENSADFDTRQHSF